MDKVYVVSPFDRVAGILGLQFLESKKINGKFDFLGQPMDREKAINYVAGQQYALYANALDMFLLEYIRKNIVNTGKKPSDISPEIRQNLGSITKELIPALLGLQTFSYQAQALFQEYSSAHKEVAEASFYTNEKSGKDGILREAFTPLYDKMLATLNTEGVVYIPAGSQKHVVIVKIEKQNDLEYTINEYNAGYGSKSAGGWLLDKTVTTDEDVKTKKEGVFGHNTWKIKGEEKEDAENKLKKVIDFYSQRHVLAHMNYDYLQTRLDKALGTPSKQMVVHVQDQPNCSTRTCRELIRGNLAPAMYAEFINYLQAQSRLETLKRVSDVQTMRDTYLEHYFSQALNQLAIAMGISESHSLSSRFNASQIDNWLIRLDEETPEAMRDIFKNIHHPDAPTWLSVSPQSLQQLFDNLHNGLDIIQAFKQFAKFEQEKPTYDASNTDKYFQSLNHHDYTPAEAPPINHVGWKRAMAYQRTRQNSVDI